MSERHPGRLHKKPAAVLAGVVLAGGILAASSTAGAMVVKTPVDLAVSNVTSAPSTDRIGSVHDTMTVSNLSPASARATITLTVTGVASGPAVPGAGITCALPTGTATGYVEVCTTDAPVVSGTDLHINFDLVPSTNLAVHSMSVKGQVALINTMPATLTDPVSTNNMSKATVAIGTAVDFQAAVTGDLAVLRTNTIGQTLSVTNNGPNAAPAKFKVSVANALEAGFSADAGITCGVAVVNVATTGFTRACTTSVIEPGHTLSLVETLTPNPLVKVKIMTVTATAGKIGATTDISPLNNKVVVPISIQDGLVLG